MSDNQPFYVPSRKPATLRAPTPTEHLWSIRLEGKQHDGELRDHGSWGVEFVRLWDREWVYGHRHESRDLAIAEAEHQKADYLRQGGVVIG